MSTYWETYTVEASAKKRLTSISLLNTLSNHSLTQIVLMLTRKKQGNRERPMASGSTGWELNSTDEAVAWLNVL
jgi:hypothetical protein